MESTSSKLTLFAAHLRALQGFKRIAVAFLFGAIAALAFSPFNLFPLFWISFPVLLILMQGTTEVRSAFWVGAAFAFGHHVFGLYWIAASMFVDIKSFWWAVPLSVAGLPAFFAIYYGIAAALTKKLAPQGWTNIIAFTLFWFLADYARGHLFTGFPWNLEGYTWTGFLPLLQSTSIFGIYGLTLLTILIASLPSALFSNLKYARTVVISGLGLLVLLSVWGALRMQAATDMVPDVRLRIVQPNTDQSKKWLKEERDKNFQELLELSSAPGEKPVTHVIWPETASTYYLNEDIERRQMIAQHLPPNGALLTGVIRYSTDDSGHEEFYNSLAVVDSKASLVAGYDKFHLVPFGEYVPFRNILPIRAIASMGLDFSSGDGPHSLRVLGLPSFSPLICYEVIFSGDVADPDDRPEFILNVTNDGWYGKTTGPHQHFDIARVRAIEEGLPLVRAANTGISGVIDAYGRMVTQLELGRQGFLDSDLPQARNTTVFNLYGRKLFWIGCVFLTVIVILLLINKRKVRK